jgi:hypothetical protein
MKRSQKPSVSSAAISAICSFTVMLLLPYSDDAAAHLCEAATNSAMVG